MATTRPSIFLGGLRLLLANKRTLLWSYLALLAVGLIGGASLHARIGPFLDHSLAAQKLAGSIDIAYYLELFQHVNEHNPGNGPVTAALTLVSTLLSFFLAAGIIYIFVSAEKPRLATILRAGVDYFWRFFRLALFAAVFAGLILGPLGWLRTVYLKRELLRLARPMSFTFHRAFDMVRDPVQALEVLISLGVDRLLTSGQRATAMEGLATLRRLGQAASGRIIVMPCGGLRADNVGQVCRETGLWELHFAAHTMEPSAMTYRNPQVAMGATSRDHEYRKTVTDPTTVRTTVEAARNELK